MLAIKSESPYFAAEIWPGVPDTFELLKAVQVPPIPRKKVRNGALSKSPRY